MENKKEVSSKNKKTMMLGVLLLIISVIIICLLSSHSKLSDAVMEDKLKNKFEKLARKYYEKNLKGQVINVDRQIITLKTLRYKKYGVSQFDNCDPKETYAMIIIDNPEERIKEKTKYEIEVHLKCNSLEAN